MGIHAPFLDTPDEDLICQICHGVLDKPVTHCQQGHTFCKECIKGWMHRPKPKGSGGGGKAPTAPHCPGCMLPLGAEIRNLVAENLIAKLRVQCTNSASASASASTAAAAGGTTGPETDKGGSAGQQQGGGPKCGWTGRLEELAHHCRTTCQYETIKCPYHRGGPGEEPATRGKGSVKGKPAGKGKGKGKAKGKGVQQEDVTDTEGEEEDDGRGSGSGSSAGGGDEESGGGGGCDVSGWRRKVMGEHAGQCPHRPVDCGLGCGWRGKKLAEARHQGTACPKAVLYCQNSGCHATFERAHAAEHYDVLCAYQPVPCVFARQGCPVTPLRKDQAKHQAEAAVEHASLTSGKITDLEQGMETILQRFEDLRQRVEHSERATRETIVSLVANPTPGIWIVLYSRIRSWNGGALLGAMNRGAIGYDRLSHAIDLFLDGVVSSALPALPPAAANAAAAAASPGESAGSGNFADAGLREAAAAAAAAFRQQEASTAAAATTAASTNPPGAPTTPAPASASSPQPPQPQQSTTTPGQAQLDDALKFLARLQQQQQQQAGGGLQPGGPAGCLFPPAPECQQPPPLGARGRARPRNNSVGNNSSGGGGFGQGGGGPGQMHFHRSEGGVVAFIEEVGTVGEGTN